MVRQDDIRALIALKFGGVAAGLLAIVASARLLDVSDRGTYVVALAAVSFVTTFLGGIPSAAAQALRRGETFDLTARSSQRLAASAGLVAAVAASIAVLVAEAPLWSLWLTASVIPTAIMQTATGLLAAGGQALRANFALFGSQLSLPPTLIVVCLTVERNPASAATAWLSSQMIGALAARALLRRGGASGAVSGLTRRSATIGTVALLSLLNYRAELLLLDAVAGDASASIYSIASTAAEVVWIVGAAVSATALNRIVRLDDEVLTQQIILAVRMVWLVSAGVATAIAAVVPFMLERVLGPPYGEAVRPTQLLLVGCTAFAPASLIGTYFTVARQSAAIPMATVVVAAVVTAVGTATLAPVHGAMGAAVACVAGYVSGMLLLLIAFVRSTDVGVRSLVPRLGDVRQVVARIKLRVVQTP